MFPLLLLAFYKKTTKTKIIIFTAIILVSLLYTEIAWRQFPAANFYLFPSRAWELLIGSLAALLNQYVPDGSSRKSNVFAGIGLGMIFCSYVFLDDEMPFPSLYAATPVFGSALVLLFATKGTFARISLSILPLVLIGRISYSLYLCTACYIIM